MKGIIFTEFIEFVEEKYGYEMADSLLIQPELKSKGIYTAVGTYDIQEMIILLTKLSKEVKSEIPDLLQVFGYYLFKSLIKLYPRFIEKEKTSFDVFRKIENHIHVEVLKLYSDAELPSLRYESITDHQMSIVYTSERKLSDLAIGLMKGAIDHFNEEVEIKTEAVENGGKRVHFMLTKKV